MEPNKDQEKLREFVDSPENWIREYDFSTEKEPQPFMWSEIDALDFPEDRWLVKNLFPKEGISIFASISGEGKSLLIMHLARCFSEGTAWFGYEEFRTNKAKVLYINLEMSVSEIQRRGRKVGFSPDNENLIILNEDSFNLNDGEGEDLKYKWLLKFIYENKIQVVIVDTFRASSGGLKEEKAEEIRKFFQKFLILKNNGVSLIFLEHVRKPTQMEGKVPKKEQLLGSQDKTANAEILLMIRKDDITGNINVYQRKNRLGNEVQPFAVKMVDVIVEGKEMIDFQYIGEIDDDVNKKEEAKELVLDILSSGDEKDVKQFAELTKKMVGIKNLRQALRELIDAKKIDYRKEGKKHMYFIFKAEPESVEESLVGQEKIDFLNDS